MAAISGVPVSKNRKPRIFLVEDDEFYGKILSYQLRSQGYDCLLCSTASMLFQLLKEQTVPDLFILDYFLGEDQPSGLEICRKIKSYFKSPVIVLTGNDNVDTLVSCLNAGAEQYVVKPCDIRELIARIEVTLRNTSVFNNAQQRPLFLKLDDEISLSWEGQCLLHKDGRTVNLTEKEMGMLEIIIDEPNRYVDRDKAFRILYGYDMDPMNRSIDVLISRLRKKLRELNDDYEFRTLRGHGYVLIINSNK